MDVAALTERVDRMDEQFTSLKDTMTEKFAQLMAALETATASAARASTAAPAPFSAEEDGLDDDEATPSARVSSTSPAAGGASSHVQGLLTKSIGKLTPLTSADLKNGVTVVMWASQFEATATACAVPVKHLHTLALPHVPPEAASSLRRAPDWRTFKKILRQKYCPDALILDYGLETLRARNQTALTSINAFDQLLSVAQLCGVTAPETFVFNIALYESLSPETQKLIRPYFKLDMPTNVFKQLALQYDTANLDHDNPAESFNHVDTSPAPASKWFARRTGTPAHELQVRQVQHLNNVNLIDSKFALTVADLPDLFPHELHALNSGSKAGVDTQVTALLKIPKQDRYERRRLTQCLICGHPMRGPGGHAWRQCPRIPDILES